MVRLVWLPEQVFEGMGRHEGVRPPCDGLLKLFGYRHGRYASCTGHKAIQQNASQALRVVSFR